MPNGSLEKFVCNRGSAIGSQLEWEKLYEIVVGIGRGLEYLHRGCNTQILHFDIKPHNILLDKDLCPKISDFGLAKLCPEKRSVISMSGMRGTPGYIAPEVFSRNFGGVSHKSDVYSYGMMVLEMVGGRRDVVVEVNDTSNMFFSHWVYKQLVSNKNLGLSGILNEEDKERVTKMVFVGLWCIQADPSSRPSMSKQSLCLDPNYEACVLHSCSENGPTITYPFFIKGLQNSTCAYPGLELHCKLGFPVLKISESEFRVEEIDYERSYLRLQTTAISWNQTISCPSDIRNLTLDPNRFLIDDDTTTKLVFISNCLNNASASLERYRIQSCQTSVELVMLANDTNLRTATETCGNGSGIVMTPVELTGQEGRIDATNYAEVLERGFVMRWRAADCGICRGSGGRCGFDSPSFQFRCFCPNGPHRVRCRSEKQRNIAMKYALALGIGTVIILILLIF
ncbi:Protein kinase, catalytic domain-containing protein, partial [Cynara cardunculus var. scolymus]